MNGAKVVPAAAPVASAVFSAHSDTLVQIGAVVAGLAFGMMWRAGSLASEGKGWKAIKSDMLVSILIMGANAVLAMALVEMLNLSTLLAMAAGVVVGATGLRALPEIRDAVVGMLKRKLLGDDVALIQPRDDDLSAKARELDRKDEK